MLVESDNLKFYPIKKILSASKGENFILILVKNSFLEIMKIGLNQKILNFSVLKFNKKIIQAHLILNTSKNIFDLIVLDDTQTISIIRLEKEKEFNITSSKNLKFELFFNKINNTFLVLSKKPSLCILCTTNGVKIFLEINRNKKKTYKFFNHGRIIKQKFLICYFITNSNIFSEKIFFFYRIFFIFPIFKVFSFL